LGLGCVDGSGAKARLTLDPAILERWQQLNPTERYFTLLEAWLLHGRPEMVGERGRSWFEASVSDCVRTWQHLPARGHQFDPKQPVKVHLPGIGRDLYHLALMDLFGLIEVGHPEEPVQPWAPTAIRHLPFGDALFTLLASWLYSDLEGRLLDAIEEPSEGAVPFGYWQPLFQPYFPQWQQNLVLPEIETQQGIFVFRVSLGKAKRVIAISSEDTVDDLVSWILRSVNFDSDHLYELTYRDRFGSEARVMHPYCDEGPWGDEILLGDLPLVPGRSMRLTYDFGDNWQFDVMLERIESPGSRKAPRILQRQGKAPKQYPDWD
jgi:hypothetical protein